MNWLGLEAGIKIFLKIHFLLMEVYGLTEYYPVIDPDIIISNIILTTAHHAVMVNLDMRWKRIVLVLDRQ